MSEETQKIVAASIRNCSYLKFSYSGRPREVIPYRYGFFHYSSKDPLSGAGEYRLLGFQVAGESNSNTNFTPDFRVFRLKEMSDLLVGSSFEPETIETLPKPSKRHLSLLTEVIVESPYISKRKNVIEEVPEESCKKIHF